jgi:hypothetical protein
VTVAYAQSGAAPDAKGESLDKMSKEVNNPLSSLTLFTNVFSYTALDGVIEKGDQDNVTWLVQPALPMTLGKDWMAVHRPLLPIMLKQSALNSSTGDFEDVEGIGDFQYVLLVGQNKLNDLFLGPGRYIWAGGLTTRFPTASDDRLGQEKFSVGPSVLGAFIGKKWTLALFAQHWSSVAGEGSREDVNESSLQYIYWYSLPDAWQIGAGPTITVNWQADEDDRWNVPVGLGVSKMVRFGKLPVKFVLEGAYSVVKEDLLGADWSVQLKVVPVLPSFF